MKILHMADCHLDAVMEQHLPSRMAKTRRRELLLTFSSAIAIGEREGVALVLLAGDLFDTPTPSAGAVRYVLDCIAAHSAMQFILIEGNHDAGALKDLTLPENLTLVPAHATATLCFGDINIHAGGFGITDEQLSALPCPAGAKNIFLLHGTLGTGYSSEREEILSRTVLEQKSIDYLALGHYHTHTAIRLAQGTLVCYAGTPEGRGFDETGKCGVILYDTETKAAEFIVTATRTLHDITVDVTGSVTLPEIERRVEEAILGIPAEDMVRLTLCGEVEEHYLKEPEQIGALLEGRFFFARVKDSIRLHLRADRYRNDISLRGEFVRRVLRDTSLSEEDRERVLSFGLRALEGELPEEAAYEAERGRTT